MNQQDMCVKIFKALGHPVRYKIVKELFEGPRCVCNLNDEIEYSQANLSQHLKLLKDAGILQSEKIGMEMHYRLASNDIKDLIKCVDRYVTNYVNNLK